MESALRELTDLAPLHLPKSLAAFDAVRAMLPEVAAVACYDTAFYTSAARLASHRALCPGTVRLPAGIGRSAALEV